ncbi:cation/H(+) antiporter 4 [Citrus sinensis]|nr:cation/H(+) antiporter 4 [Citrus sinensis]
MDPTMITRVSKKALYVGLLAVSAPLVAALLIPPVFNIKQLDCWKTLYISPCYTSSSFPTISCLLNDLRITNSELGRTGLSSAIVSDLLGIVLIVAFSSDREAVQVGIRVFVKRLFYVSVFLVFIFMVIRPTMKLLVQCTPGGKPVHPIVVTILTMLFLFSVCITKWFPQFMVSAPYVLGLAVPHGPPLGSALVEKFEGMVDQLLLPLFVTAWMRASTFNFFASIVPVLVKALHDPSRKYAGYYRRNIMDAKLNSELQIVALSPPSLMQDDICTLALDELASLIILPFDRTCVRLTVVHLTAANCEESEGWDKVLDSVMSRDIKTNGCMNYIEKEVNDDGPETTVIIRSMVNEFDLILVGRRYNLESQQTSGLKEWSEFPELGILGDLLASVEFSGRCSALVVQQQQIRKATSLK